MKKLGNYVKEKRLDLGLSQNEFGDYVGVSYITIHNVETQSKCGLATLRKLSKALDVDTKDLRAMMVQNEDNE